jgi:hypothetical protein
MAHMALPTGSPQRSGRDSTPFPRAFMEGGRLRPSPLPPGFIPPCLRTACDRCKSGPDWVREIKHDGYRLIARGNGDRVRLYTRASRARRVTISTSPSPVFCIVNAPCVPTVPHCAAPPG